MTGSGDDSRRGPGRQGPGPRAGEGPTTAASPLDAAPLDAAWLREDLVTSGPCSRLEVVEAVDSTNLELTRAARDPGFSEAWPHLSVLTAEEQTGATGRLGRGWSSPPRTSLSTSVVLRPGRDGTDPARQLPWISLVAGLSLVETLRDRQGIPARLKWPNDVHVEGRKISGILSVLAPTPGGAGVTVVLGVGINVLLQAVQLPTPTSTSVLLELHRLLQPPGAEQGRDPHDGAGETRSAGGPEDLRTRVLAGLLHRLAENLAELEQEAASGASIRDSALGRRLRQAMDTLGQEVRVELPGGGAERGAAVGLEEDGSLLVEVTHRRADTEGAWLPAPGPAAERRRGFSAGDVVHLRRAES